MKRRQLLTGLVATCATSTLVAGSASAGWLSDIKDAITGHASDAVGRVFGEDMVLQDATIVASGTFDEDAVGQDAAHWAKGTVEIKEKDAKLYIQLASDFSSGPLPDGYVYFSMASDINDEGDFNSTPQKEAGKLLLGVGASYYELPAGTKLEEIKSVTVWCKRFGAYIGSADVNV